MRATWGSTNFKRWKDDHSGLRHHRNGSIGGAENFYLHIWVHLGVSSLWVTIKGKHFILIFCCCFRSDMLNLKPPRVVKVFTTTCRPQHDVKIKYMNVFPLQAHWAVWSWCFFRDHLCVPYRFDRSSLADSLSPLERVVGSDATLTPGLWGAFKKHESLGFIKFQPISSQW